jgi:hypothetical protein
MSENGTTSDMSNPAEAGPKLYDAAGEPLRPNTRPTQGQTDQIAEFIQQQPVTAALIALVVGYFWGKIA